MAPRAAVPLLAAVLTAAAVAPAHAAPTAFQTPSKQIRCAYIRGTGLPTEIRCDLAFLNDRAVVLTHKGRARKVRVTDTVADPRAPVLRYGTTRRFGAFTCTSRRSGLTCRSTRSGHGFTVSRQSQKLF